MITSGLQPCPMRSSVGLTSNVIVVAGEDRMLEANKIMQLSNYPHKADMSADGYLSVTPGMPLLHMSPMNDKMVEVVEEETGARVKVYPRAEDVPGPVGFD